MTGRLAASLAVLTLLGAGPGDTVASIPDLLARRPDGVRVDLTGIVAIAQPATSEDGRDYEILGLCQERCITVYVARHLRLNEGDAVRVSGTYRQEVRVGPRTFENEVVATTVQPIPIPKTRS